MTLEKTIQLLTAYSTIVDKDASITLTIDGLVIESCQRFIGEDGKDLGALGFTLCDDDDSKVLLSTSAINAAQE